MLYYILRRVFYVIPIVIGVSLVVFSLVHLAPGDPVAAIAGEADQRVIDQLRRELGFDQPLPVQYVIWLGNVVTGDLGVSLLTGRPVLGQVLVAALNTLVIGTFAAVIGCTFGVLAGLIAGYTHGSVADKFVTSTAVAGVSMPHFWLAILLVIVFSVELGWLPAMGMGQGLNIFSWSDLRYMVLPTIALAAIPAAIIARTTRAAVVEILGQEFVEALRAKGISEIRIGRHVVKNAMAMVLAVIGLQYANLLGGSILVETVFSWPGTGYLLNNAIFGRDLPLLQGTILILAMYFVILNLVVDILQSWIDPRIRRG